MRFLFLFGVVASVLARAQEADTTFLKEVSVYGLPVTSYAIGSKVERITGGELMTLSGSLQGNPSLYLKSYGNNQLSTLSLRGTTASQTAVLWRGININSPTLGQTDLSLIPMFFFDEASLHYGNSSSLYGSDAIGGSILLGQAQPTFASKFNTSFTQIAGSFGKLATGIKTEYGGNRWQFRTKGYWSSVENNFSYYSPAIGFRKNQTHAAVKNYGVDQQIDFKISEKQWLSAEAMYTHNFREIQPPTTNDQADETLRDKHLRSAITYQHDFRSTTLSTTAAYVLSDQDYTNDVTTNVKSHHVAALINLDHSVNSKTNLRYGASYNYYTALSPNYTQIADNRADLFASYKLTPTDRLAVNVNARQSFYEDRYAPFAPTVGSEFKILRGENRKLNVRAQAGRGFRVPTLNDRYWKPGGNPDLKPEQSYQVETGVEFIYNRAETTFQFSAGGYRSWIRNMIVWVDQNLFWAPVNFQDVKVTGLETALRCKGKLNAVQLEAVLSYSRVRSLNQDFQNLQTHNKQLPYVPEHNFKTDLSAHFHEWIAGFRYAYTGVRETTIDNAEYLQLPDFDLLDFSIQKKFAVNRWSFSLKADANNLLNTYYENLKNRAMPGRNYQLTFILTNKSK
jgi:vitamin B12 transporter